MALEYFEAMFEIPELTDVQRRLIYIVLGGSLAIGALFFSLAQGNASPSPKPTISLAPMATTSPTP